jgi:hypothetical protein
MARNGGTSLSSQNRHGTTTLGPWTRSFNWAGHRGPTAHIGGLPGERGRMKSRRFVPYSFPSLDDHRIPDAMLVGLAMPEEREHWLRFMDE